MAKGEGVAPIYLGDDLFSYQPICEAVFPRVRQGRRGSNADSRLWRAMIVKSYRTSGESLHPIVRSSLFHQTPASYNVVPV
jgi:hypothetical protein